jgi:hypothetical protein
MSDIFSKEADPIHFIRRFPEVIQGVIAGFLLPQKILSFEGQGREIDFSERGIYVVSPAPLIADGEGMLIYDEKLMLTGYDWQGKKKKKSVILPEGINFLGVYGDFYFTDYSYIYRYDRKGKLASSRSIRLGWSHNEEIEIRMDEERFYALRREGGNELQILDLWISSRKSHSERIMEFQGEGKKIYFRDWEWHFYEWNSQNDVVTLLPNPFPQHECKFRVHQSILYFGASSGIVIYNLSGEKIGEISTRKKIIDFRIRNIENVKSLAVLFEDEVCVYRI